MHVAGVYILTVILGGVAFWRCGLLYPWIHVNGFTGRLETPDPVDCPVFLAYMLTPLPGLISVANFFAAVWTRAHEPNPAQRKRMVAT